MFILLNYNISNNLNNTYKNKYSNNCYPGYVHHVSVVAVSDSEAGKFSSNIYAYPTTYVVDRNGKIVGEPIVGAITEKKQSETLKKLIDQAIAADKH